jgi:plastocyanin
VEKMDDAQRTQRRLWWLPVAALLALMPVTVAACGGDDDDESSDTTAADESGDDAGGGGDATLEVTEFEFSDVTAPAGGTLEVVNSSGGAHTVTADDGAFDESLPDGDTITVDVPAEPGDYPFHCEIHPSMEATLTAE